MSNLTIDRSVHTVVWHYSLTAPAWENTFRDEGGRLDGAALVDEIRRWHLARGFRDVGYHRVFGSKGESMPGRPKELVGAGVRHRNSGKVHLCYVGGIAADGTEGVDTRTNDQSYAMWAFTRDLMRANPSIRRVVGHRDLAPTQCPGFDAGAAFRSWLSKMIDKDLRDRLSVAAPYRQPGR